MFFCMILSSVISVPRLPAIASPLQTSQAQALIAAIDKPDIARVKALLAAGVSPDTLDSNGLSALMHAASKGSVPLCELLLQKGASLDGSPNMKMNPLAMAVTKKHPEVVKFLLEQGADPNSTDPDGKTPLFFAVAEGEVDSLKILLSKGADPNAHDKMGATPLRIAYEKNEKKKGEDVLKQVANNNAVMELVAAGADAPEADLLIAVKDHDFKTATALLDAHANPDTVVFFDVTPFNAACTAGDLDWVRLLAAHGANINTPKASHTVPLLTALMYGNMEVTRFLLEKGADASVKDEYGNNALMLMQIHGSVQIARLLVEHGAPVRAKDPALQRTVLAELARSADASVLQYLLDQGALADLNARDGEGGTPLISAAFTANLGAVKLLLEKGADPNSVDLIGNTALHYAVERLIRAERSESDQRLDGIAVIKLLLQHGAKRETRNKEGKTPLALAQEEKCRPAIEALKPTASGGK